MLNTPCPTISISLPSAVFSKTLAIRRTTLAVKVTSSQPYRVEELVDVRRRIDTNAIEVVLRRIGDLALDARAKAHLGVDDEVVHELEPGVVHRQVLVELGRHLADLNTEESASERQRR